MNPCSILSHPLSLLLSSSKISDSTMKLLSTWQEAHQETLLRDQHKCLRTLLIPLPLVPLSTTTMDDANGGNCYPYYSYNDPSSNNNSYGSLGSTPDQESAAAAAADAYHLSQELLNFQVSEFLEFGGWMEEEGPTQTTLMQASAAAAAASVGYEQSPEVVQLSDGSSSQQHENTVRRESGNSSTGKKKEIKEKIAFKTKSEIEILDDGFKWRKYGKKMVKNSPNPRNYYRCSVEGCPVKKRVERDKEDHRYVITTYEGIHTHEGPSQF